MQKKDGLGKALNAIREASRLLLLTGAGVSAESGVPTFRGGGETWRGLPFQELSSANMVNENLPLVWEWFDYRRSVINGCKPNELISRSLRPSEADDGRMWLWLRKT